MVFEAAPEHVERSGVIDCELKAMVVGLWWMCEDNRCKVFRTKEVKGMGREPGILTTHSRPRFPGSSLFSSIFHQATGLINLKREDGGGTICNLTGAYTPTAV